MTARLDRALVVIAAVLLFREVWEWAKIIGQHGYEQGWWGNGLGPKSVAGVLSIAVSAAVVAVITRLVGRTGA